MDNINVLHAKYVASAVRADQYPPDGLPEVAFIGRSNVGKSSLLNSLCRNSHLARISGTPGKTQTINFYEVNMKQEEERKKFFLVDLPGYGYARTGQQNRQRWAAFIEDYLVASPHLKLICQLVDIRHAPMAIDVSTYFWLQDKNLPVAVIATKADKLSKTAAQRSLQLFKQELALPALPIGYSSEKNTGRDSLLELISSCISV